MLTINGTEIGQTGKGWLHQGCTVKVGDTVDGFQTIAETIKRQLVARFFVMTEAADIAALTDEQSHPMTFKLGSVTVDGRFRAVEHKTSFSAAGDVTGIEVLVASDGAFTVASAT